jgi:hypothetical protein
MGLQVTVFSLHERPSIHEQGVQRGEISTCSGVLIPNGIEDKSVSFDVEFALV